PLEKVKIVQCTPGTKLKGNGTGGSRSTVGAGSVCHLAAKKLVEEGKALAALELSVEPSQVEYGKGTFRTREARRSREREAVELHGGRQVRLDVSQRLSHRRGRGRSGHRRHKGRVLLRG